jgi:hypothetical protein
MYDKSDPRSALASATKPAKPVTDYFGAEYGRFYETEPQEKNAKANTWYARGQNNVVAYSEAEPGAVFRRDNQPDEYVVLIPEKETAIEIATAKGTEKIPGHVVTFVPPGASTVKVLTKGRIIRMFTPKSKDLAAKCSNAASFTKPHPTIPPFEPWPEPPDGLTLRWYSLDVAPEPGRFGRIFRCTTFMVNYLEARMGPRDPGMVSPHHHDDFEQCSLALHGVFVHHLRWPWTTNMRIWRDDVHARCAAPSVCFIPPPAIHTSTSEDPCLNQLVDIFSPPRMDFSSKPGWVLNDKDYPMPPAKA